MNNQNDMRKYPVYATDLKHKNLRNIDPKKSIWCGENTEHDFYNKDYDTLEHRINECISVEYKYLDLSNLNLNRIPIQELKKHKNFDKISNILYLFIDNNNIEVCLDELLYFKNLEALDISHNKLTEIKYIPDKLKEFSCYNNHLKSLPDSNSVEKLDCSDNKLSSLPKMDNILDIICYNNYINEIKTFPKINKIVCKNNPIIKIYEQPKLEHLDCSMCGLKGALKNLPNLAYLICNNTNVDTIENLSSLKTLEMFDSKINKLPYISTLEDLMFSRNQDISIHTKYEVDFHINENNNCFVRFKKSS